MSIQLVKKIFIYIVIIIVIILMGFGYYNYIYKPSKIIESVNRNVSILNENLSDTQDIIDNINGKYKKVNDVEITDSENIQTANNELKFEIELIEKVIKKNSDDLEKINEGIDIVTLEFADLAKDSINKRNIVLTSIKNVIEFDTCLNAYYFNLLNSNQSASDSIKKLNETTLNNENTIQIIEINNETVASLNKSIESFVEIDKCIENSKKDLLPTSDSQLIKNDVLTYQAFVESLLNFNKGLEENNIELINSSQVNLDDNNLVSIFLKDNIYQENITITNKIIAKNYEDLKEIEEKIDNKITEIKDKFDLQTV